MKKVLITGADGIVGKRLIEKCVKEGLEPTAFVRTAKEREFFDSLNVPMIVGSANDSSLVNQAIEGKEAVVHLIGTFEPENGSTLDDINNSLSYQLHQAAEEHKIKKFIFLSAYGASLAVHNPFLVSKGNAEVDIMQGEVPYFIIKSTPIYSKENPLGKLFRSWVQNKKASLIGTGKEKIQPIYVDDVVEYLYKAIIDPKARQQVLEIGGPDKVSYSEIVQLLSEVSGQTVVLSKPLPLIGSFFSSVKINGNKLPEDQIDFYSRENFVSNDRANEVVSVFLTPLRDGLKKII